MARIEAPDSGVIVRMYRLGHGDCFLLVFRDDDGDPFYMLVDCGYLPGSEIGEADGGKKWINKVVDDIGEATGHHLHVVLITHEHQDHVNGFRASATREYFDDFTIDRLWLAWTEDPEDDLANELREKHHDTLLGLMAAGDRMAAAAADSGVTETGKRIEDLLQFEIEGDRDEYRGLLAIAGITNKEAIKYIKDKTGRAPLYLQPHGRANWLPNVGGVNVYALGPPRDEALLRSNDPEAGEGYKQLYAADADGTSFLAAALSGTEFVRGDGVDEANQPFAPRYRMTEPEVKPPGGPGVYSGYFDGKWAWRRIDHDWLRTAEALALRLNSGVNNTCLVVAFELPNTKKVLLFPGDAQRGNWVSWDDGNWTNGDGEEVEARDLLGRCVFYKVGHHGSHNATLKGYAGSDYPNLNWMAQGEYRDDYVAMIPANPKWAAESKNWTHPLPSIEDAVNRKAKGRVFRADRDHVKKKSGITKTEWDEFQDRIEETELYFEYRIPDDV